MKNLKEIALEELCERENLLKAVETQDKEYLSNYAKKHIKELKENIEILEKWVIK